MGNRFRNLLGGVALALALSANGPAPAGDAPPPGLSVDRVVLLMRHGVRPPTKAVPMPAGTAVDPWPSWPVPPGWLTPHGAEAIGRLGSWDGARLRRLGVLPATGCPEAGAVTVIADSDQRTIATADAWLAALAPGCAISNRHRPQDEPDPIFSAIEQGQGGYDPRKADAAVAAAVGPGGIAAVETRHRALLTLLDKILCGAAKSGCGVSAEPSSIGPATAGKRPKLGGALDRASTASQILLLEYAEGKPMAEVGWGRATPHDIAALSAFHALEFRLLARPPHVAAANLAGIAPILREGLTGKAVVTLVSGHDTNVANLGGLLDVHWQVPGIATDDPAPGGAIVLERLRDAKGGLYVRALYRAQTLDQIRSAAPLGPEAPYRAVLAIPGCNARGVVGLCTLAQFEAKLTPALH
ncbi:histidine-type phosphatase [Sphingomonas sp. R-74633]|uniref:histidine-type phosphatase n=1 Tax=Sphingomonas sp. R-74633 TaxID=2751188 RepID=UPI0015D4380F|nr:histidine-type phosphatase [Sphingomonas sp. R-74633]NYT41988.1 histidine-type phosphatase [Sphingomonas sp. R-74633]